MEERENQSTDMNGNACIASEQQSSSLSKLNIILNSNHNNNTNTNTNAQATRCAKTSTNHNNNEHVSDNNCVNQQWPQSSLATIEREPLEVCYGCRRSLISAKIIMNVDGYHKYHVDCLKCHKCKQSLAEAASCFVLDDEIYCKTDYTKRLTRAPNAPIKCTKCMRPISSSDWVRRANSLIYHLACFACDKCNRQLSTGEQFTLELACADSFTSNTKSKSTIIDSGKVKLLCKLHFSASIIAGNATSGAHYNNRCGNNKSNLSTSNWSADDSVESSTATAITALNQRISGAHNDVALLIGDHQQHDDSDSIATINESDEGCKSSSSMDHSHSASAMSRSTLNFGHSTLNLSTTTPTMATTTTTSTTTTSTATQQRPRSHQQYSLCADGRSTSPSSCGESKSKRVRTTFTEEQLQVLQANFQVDSNPDGQDLERIATLTGLSKRVTQVWFQNSRARQKKYMTKTTTITIQSSSQHFAQSSSSDSSNSSSPINSMSLDNNNNNNNHRQSCGAKMTHTWSPHSDSADITDV